MKDIQYIIRKIAWRFMHFNREYVNDFFRKNGVTIGKNVRINSNILTAESYLIELGDNITISDHVSFITHDNSIAKTSAGILNGGGDLYGKIKIGNDCFIGAHSILMYGVSLADNVIVASGSVVTKSIKESGVIIGGNPARIIGTVDRFSEKNKDRILKLSSLPAEEKKKILLSSDKLISR